MEHNMSLRIHWLEMSTLRLPLLGEIITVRVSVLWSENHYRGPIDFPLHLVDGPGIPLPLKHA